MNVRKMLDMLTVTYIKLVNCMKDTYGNVEGSVVRKLDNSIQRMETFIGFLK